MVTVFLPMTTSLGSLVSLTKVRIHQCTFKPINVNVKPIIVMFYVLPGFVYDYVYSFSCGYCLLDCVNVFVSFLSYSHSLLLIRHILLNSITGNSTLLFLP